MKEKLGTWYDILIPEFSKPYMRKLANYLTTEYQTKTIYPKVEDIFNAFKLCSYDEVKVVIIGQDPYHSPNTAHGLAFSSLLETTPPSLRNIFEELRIEGIGSGFNTNNLTTWSEQGILLLNTVLTVEARKPLSHANLNWTTFTDKVIENLDTHNNKIVFMLWGAKARQYKSKIKNPKHLILEAPHPSPLSAHRGFFGCGHFKKANEFIKTHYNKTINFNL